MHIYSGKLQRIHTIVRTIIEIINLNIIFTIFF